MLELLLAAQAALNLYQWEPATGPVFGYHVYVNERLVQTSYEPEVWLDVDPGDVVEVQAVDSDYRTGPFSEPSVPHAMVPSAVIRDSPACLADVTGDGVVNYSDYLDVVYRIGEQCACDGDLDGDLLIHFGDVADLVPLIGQTCP
jgi:hypothetical protein